MAAFAARVATRRQKTKTHDVRSFIVISISPCREFGLRVTRKLKEGGDRNAGSAPNYPDSSSAIVGLVRLSRFLKKFSPFGLLHGTRLDLSRPDATRRKAQRYNGS